jgi:hypothetical protein
MLIKAATTIIVLFSTDPPYMILLLPLAIDDKTQKRGCQDKQKWLAGLPANERPA